MNKLPLFREDSAKRRCLIPATRFYEWQKREDGKQPYRFRRKDLEPFAFAGLWEFAQPSTAQSTARRYHKVYNGERSLDAFSFTCLKWFPDNS